MFGPTDPAGWTVEAIDRYRLILRCISTEAHTSFSEDDGRISVISKCSSIKGAQHLQIHV